MTLKHGSDTVLLLDFYLSGCILLAVCVIGILCNCLVAVVLTRKSMRTSTNTFLLTLAFYDSLLLFCTILLVCLPPLSETFKRHVHPFVMCYLYPVALIAQTCTIWITVSFTTERYIAVGHPLKASTMCTIKRARLTCITVTVIGILYNISRWFEYNSVPETRGNGTEPVLIEGTDLQAYRLEHTELGGSSIYEMIYFTCLYVPFMSVIPTIALAVLNTLLIRAIHKSETLQRSMGNKTNIKKENNINIMLVSVVIVFIICQVPALIYNVAYGISKKKVANSIEWQMVSIVRNFTVTVNSAVNFLLYCAFGQKFRKVFLQIFCKKVTNERDRVTMMTSNGSSNQHSLLMEKYSVTPSCNNNSKCNKTSGVNLMDKDENEMLRLMNQNGDTEL